MITWGDFVLDEVFGPLLSCDSRLGSSFVVMEDASGANSGGFITPQIQETGQEKSPARMVGLASLDSTKKPLRQEAGQSGRVDTHRGREG